MVSGRPAILNLRLDSRPESAGLVRAALGGLATPFALRAELLDDLKTAISEACNNAVEHGYRGQNGVIAVHVDVGFEGVEASVRDWGGGFRGVGPKEDRMGVGLPVINALASRAEFLTAPGNGTEVRMSFDMPHDSRRDALLAALEESKDLAAWTPWRWGLAGDVVVTLVPRELLSSVLEPLSNALAARARFSLERFCDVYLVTQAVAAHVLTAGSSTRASFAMTAGEQQLDLTIGPLRAGAGEALPEQVGQLADEIATESRDDSELVRVVVRDGDRIPRAVHGGL